MAVSIKLIKEFDITKSTSKAIVFKLYNKSDLNYDDFNVRLVIKSHSSLEKSDHESVLNKYVKIVNELLVVNIDPEISDKLLVTKSGKPYILAIRISSKKYRYSQEYLYGLNVKPNVINNIY